MASLEGLKAAMKRDTQPVISHLESSLSECQERESRLREACEAAHVHVVMESATFPAPATWDEITKLKLKLSAALEVKK